MPGSVFNFTEIAYRKKATKTINMKTLFNKTKSRYQMQLEILERDLE